MCSFIGGVSQKGAWAIGQTTIFNMLASAWLFHRQLKGPRRQTTPEAPSRKRNTSNYTILPLCLLFLYRFPLGTQCCKIFYIFLFEEIILWFPIWIKKVSWTFKTLFISQSKIFVSFLVSGIIIVILKMIIANIPIN